MMKPFPSEQEFIAMGEEVLSQLPEGILSRLNGGIIIRSEKKINPEGGESSLILGQYVHKPYTMGRYILIFYGSFRALYLGSSRKELKKRLRETIHHELQHHWEDLSGNNRLAREENKGNWDRLWS